MILNNKFFFKIKPGDRFFTPLVNLEKSISSRVFYTPKGLLKKNSNWNLIYLINQRTFN